MERPEQHITDSKGQTQLRQVFDAFGWTLSPNAVDYGSDFEAEVFLDHQSTGITFKVQLKSHLETEYTGAGVFVSERLSVKRARYLALELQTPTVLVHANVGDAKTFWVAPQLDAALIKALERRGNESTITIRIPVANSLPATRELLLQAITEAKAVLAVRSIAQTPTIDFVSALRKQPDYLDDAIQKATNAAAILRAHRAHQLMLAHDLKGAADEYAGLIGNTQVPLEVRFIAVVGLEQVAVLQSVRDEKSDAERARLSLDAAEHLRRLTKKGPRHLKIYAILTKKIAELSVLMTEHWGLQLNTQLAREHGTSPEWAAILQYRAALLTTRINLKLQQCEKLVDVSIRSRDGWAITDPLVRMGKALVLLATQVRALGRSDAAEQALRDKAFELFKLGAEIAARIGDQQRVAEAATAARLLSGEPTATSFLWMRETLDKITNGEVIAAALAYLERMDRREAGEKFPYEIKTTEKQIYENVALGAGIDLSDENDPVAQRVRTGVRDLDPSRVLRECEHIFITLQPDRRLMDTLKLQTAGKKVLHCTRHGHAVRSASLDAGYDGLRQRFCSNCQDASPRPSEWVYSNEWQIRENFKHSMIAGAFWDRRKHVADSADTSESDAADLD